MPSCQYCGKEPKYANERSNGYITYNFMGEPCIEGRTRHQVMVKKGKSDAAEIKQSDLNFPLDIDLDPYDSIVITSAQSDTKPKHADLKALEFYCEHNNIPLIIIPFTYLNRGNPMYDNSTGHTWHERLLPYLSSERIYFGDWVVFGDISITPTKQMPLSGVAHMGKGKSAAFGHTRLHLTTIDGSTQKRSEIAVTSSAITQENYTDSVSGSIGEFNHIIGGVRLYRDGRVRTLQTKGYKVCDLNEMYDAKEEKVTQSAVKALILGDTHAGEMDELVWGATYDEDGVIDTLDPEIVVHHDIHSQAHESKHNNKDPFARERARIEQGSVQEELDKSIAILELTSDRRTMVVKSNHDDHLGAFIKERDWRKLSGSDRMLYLEIAQAWSEAVANEEPFNPLEYALGDYAEFIGANKSFKVMGIELGLHGDKGANGARGAPNGFKKVADPMVAGHNHRHTIIDGYMSVGTSSRIDLPYVGPLGGWSQGHGCINALGKRQPIILRDGGIY